MAWAIATYVEHLAARGRAIADIPMYANAWLGPQPGQDTPGQYPSGGPTSTVLDIWRAAAPSLAFLGPDIYVHDADAAMAQYATGIQPFFVPECRLSAAELVRAIGTYGAVGWSGYGLDARRTPTRSSRRRSRSSRAWRVRSRRRRCEASIDAVVLEPGVEAETRQHRRRRHHRARRTRAASGGCCSMPG